MISFYSISSSGTIYQSVIEVLDKLTEVKYDLILPGEDKFSQADFLLSLFRDDIVIVDCTIPENINAHSIYPILVAQINMLDNILVLSETDLPVNIKPLRNPYYVHQESKNDKRYKNIEDWLNNNIKEIFNNINAKTSMRISVDSINDLLGYKADMEQIQSQAAEWHTNQIKGTGKKNILISYRSKYYYNDYTGTEIPLVERIHPVNYKDDYKPHIFEPQSLCSGDEVLTPMRKWMLVGMLDDRIRLMDELWIYYTPDYFDSWWTISELVSVAYFNSTTGKDHPLVVRIYNPETNKLTTIDLEKDLNIDMSLEYQDGTTYVDRMARLMANTRPDIMAPEAREDIQRVKSIAGLLQNSPRLIRNFILKRIRKSVVSMSKLAMPQDMKEEEREEILNRILKMYSDPKIIIDYANDEVFANDFWYRMSYGIHNTDIHIGDVVITPEKIKLGSINLQIFFEAPMKDLINYSEDEFLDLDKSQIAFKNSDGETVEGEISSITTLYLWHGTKMGVVGGKDKSGLEPIKVYHFKERRTKEDKS